MVDPRQYDLPFIRHVIQGELVEQRSKDGYINATAMCKAANRPWSRYWDTRPTKEFADALAADVGIPISELIQSVNVAGDTASDRSEQQTCVCSSCPYRVHHSR